MTMSSMDPLWRIYTTLAQYPILRTRIRARMRKKLFEKGIISPQEFEALVREHAIRSQQREGVPRYGDPEEVWETRRDRIRSHLTDLYFAYHLPLEMFEEIVREVLAEKAPHAADLDIIFNPEFASEELLVEQASLILQMSPEERQRYAAREQELKAVLIRRIISDQLAYVALARQWLTLEDLLYIVKRKIGPGKIGGKAAGMILAHRVLVRAGDEDIQATVKVPESFFLGSDVMYAFMVHNGLMRWADQKYKSRAEIEADYPQVRAEFLRGRFPADIEHALRDLLEQVGQHPLIVRSSSLLEDNFGASFAGKYDSFFCANQGTLQQNLDALVQAIAGVYASALAPEPLLYRQARGLLDYDERIAILIQKVQGETFRHFFFPQAAGVAFSRNLFRWSPQIRLEDGFVRLVWGLGTRAVDRVGDDYPRLVALSHPLLRPEATAKEVRRYSQRHIDLIDLSANAFRTLSIYDVVDRRYPALRFIFSLDAGGYITPLHSTFLPREKIYDLVVTFEEWLRRTPFADRMRRILHTLENAYQRPVDLEFTARLLNPQEPNPDVEITIVQCRPQSTLEAQEAALPEHVPPEDVVIETHNIVPQGAVPRVEYVLFVPPEGYYQLTTPAQRARLVQSISTLNAQWAATPFICVGPGRWGTRNPELGVQVGYADIYNAKALVELSSKRFGVYAEPSFGTHFFQDLMESNILPLAVDLDDPRTRFDRAFFYDTPNRLTEFLPDAPPELQAALRVIRVEDYRPGRVLRVVSNATQGRALIYFPS
ncbi:MAG: hypothetical protein GXO37_06665 [Chloroflexi bacterium]|nr:hypothetical protein [Chloroflexota bacterium]